MPTTKLTIQVPLEWWDKEEIKELEKKGHTIVLEPSVDLMLGPKCHYYWVEEMFGEGYLKLALKRVSKERKEKEGGKGKES